MGERVFLNAGCGEAGSGAISPHFQDWREVRLDLDPATKPDIVADFQGLGCIADSSFDAVWSSHSLEHLFAHEVPAALLEFRRILKPDGFVCLLVPDLQAAARAIADDKLSEPLYPSPSGPITPHDMVFGYGPALARGSYFMAHRCGFTPNVLGRAFVDAGFAEVIVRRRTRELELAALASKVKPSDPVQRIKLLESLGI